MQRNLKSNPPGRRIQPGQLDSFIRRTSQIALSSGALQPIKTSTAHVEDRGIRFAIHKLDSLERKHRASVAEKRLQAAASTDINPFLPYDPELYVGDITASHAAVLNKYYVVPNHLLIITRSFVPQETFLDEDDMEAAWHCLREFESLVFYNAGVVAGASQPHRHLQLLPLPLEPGKYQFPTEPVLLQALDEKQKNEDFSFVYAVADMSAAKSLAQKHPRRAAEKSLEIYLSLMELVGLGSPSQSSFQAGPYNLLLTRRLMMVAPRSREHANGISINALGYAGSLLVRNKKQLDKLLAIGPMNALEKVSVSRPGDR